MISIQKGLEDFNELRTTIKGVKDINSLVELIYDNPKYDITNDLINRKNNSINNLVSNPKKRVYMYNNKMEFIGTYESGMDIIRLMPYLNLTVKGIQKVCAKYQKSHRGYIFSYVPLHQENQSTDSLLLCSNE